MPANIKQLVVILAIATMIFVFGKSLALRFMSAEDFSRRRKVWFALTVAAFLSPSFWIFTLFAIPLLIWAGRKDSNPIALYLMLLHVIPPIPVEIPVVGIGELFELDIYRLLSFCVLIPTAWRVRQSKDSARIQGLEAMDYLLLAYGAVQIALFIPPDLPNHVILQDSITNVLRRAFLFFVDVYVLYFSVSRASTSPRLIIEALAAFCLASAVMAATAGFESLRHWLLYADLAVRWNPLLPEWSFYITRGGAVRATASAGHSLALGYLLAIAFGFWLYLSPKVNSRLARMLVVLLFWIGLISAYSRGPWIGAVVIFFAFAATGPRAATRLLKAAGVGVLALGALSLSPLGERIVSVLPYFGGSVDNANVLYRERLADRSWELIKQHPFFGDQLAYTKMEDLRQGQGIIDLVNSYASVALFYGLVGLSLFVAFILMGLSKAYYHSRRLRRSDPEFALLGACLVSCIAGTLLMIENCSFFLGYGKLFYVLAGFAATYAHLGVVLTGTRSKLPLQPPGGAPCRP
jgi:hypothetical protein